MANLKFRYLSETKYNTLTEEEKKVQETMFMVKGKNCAAIYNNGVRYASSADFHIIDSEVNLPSIGDPNLLYVTKDGGIYVWDDNSLRYIDALSSNFDIINGGDASSQMDIEI